MIDEATQRAANYGFATTEGVLPMSGRMTHTYAPLPISEEAFNEISDKLMKAGYEHAVIVEAENEIHLDMHGIALVREPVTDAETIRKGLE